MSCSPSRIFLLPFTLVHLLFVPLSCSRSEDPPSGPASTSSKNAPKKTSPPKLDPEAGVTEIVFAGLSGLAPRYIETGPFKGMGWIENQTLEIRKGLEQDGFKIKMEWMTPARIAHEFRTKSPICTYPAEWNRPKELFSKKPDRLYSLALTLGGEEHRSIIFRSVHLKKFQKHVDSKGNLNLDSLIHDSALKTLLIRDKSYGPLTQTLTDTNAQGDQVVRPAFIRNVFLLVINDNRQIIEMLNADRFDYTFSDAIENRDFKVSGLDTSQFTHLNYISSGVRTKDDPNLIQVSITCSDHPETKRAIPHINKWISTFRETTWRKRKLDYQNLLDRNAPTAQSIWEGTVQRFRGQFEKGDLDEWWTLQAGHFPGLKKFPDPVEVAEEATQRKEPLPLNWFFNLFTRGKEGQLILFNESAATFNPMDEAQRSFDSMYTPFRFSRITEYFPKDYFKRILDRDQPLPSDFEALPDPSTLREITLIAPGITPLQLKKLEPLFAAKTLESLKLFGASPSQTCSILHQIQGKLRALNLAASSVTGCDFVNLLKNWNLEELHLNNSQVSELELYSLLTGQSTGQSDEAWTQLKKLSLGFLRGSWTERNARAFSKNGSPRFPNLTFLDLENNFLTDREFKALAPGIPRQLLELRLGSNHLTPETLIPFFLTPFPKLKSLDLADSIVVTKGVGRPPLSIRFSKSIEALVLSNSGINEDNLIALHFPDSLHTLDLSNNPIAGGDLSKAFAALQKNVEFLDLSNSRMTGKSVTSLAALPLSKIRTLRLANNLLSDEDLFSLSRANYQIQGIDLSGNAVQDASVSAFASQKVGKLVELDLSGNLISSATVRQIAENISPQLEVLKLSSVLSLDLNALAPRLPRKLRVLDLSNNQLSNEQIRILAPHLPQTLEHLILANSSFNALGVRDLAHFLPRHLNRLIINNTPLDGSGIALLAQALPQSLRELRLGSSVLSERQEQTLARFLPKALLRIGIEKFSTLSGDCIQLFRSLPETLSVLEFLSSPLSGNSAHALSGRLPPNIREIRFEGTSARNQDISSLAKGLPSSLEQFMFFAANLGTKGLVELGRKPLPNLRILSFGFDQFSWKDFESVLKVTPAPPVLTLTGIRWSDTGALKDTDPELFRKVRVLKTGNSNLSSSEMLALLAHLPETLWYMDMSSARLLPGAVDEAIGSLPNQLSVLFVTGLDIGQIGLEKFRKWKDANQDRRQIGVRLVE